MLKKLGMLIAVIAVLAIMVPVVANADCGCFSLPNCASAETSAETAAPPAAEATDCNLLGWINPCGWNLNPCGLNLNPCNWRLPNINPCGLKLNPCGWSFKIPRFSCGSQHSTAAAKLGQQQWQNNATALKRQKIVCTTPRQRHPFSVGVIFFIK